MACRLYAIFVEHRWNSSLCWVTAASKRHTYESCFMSKKTDFILDWPSVTLMRCFLNSLVSSILLRDERHKFIVLSVKSWAALILYCVFEMTSRAITLLTKQFKKYFHNNFISVGANSLMVSASTYSITALTATRYIYIMCLLKIYLIVHRNVIFHNFTIQ